MNHSQPTPTEDSLSHKVIEAVAQERGTEPEDLPETLHNVVDTDALDALFAGQGSRSGLVTFRFCEYTVTVTGDGDVTLEE
ncbi:hypothetical protein SAMN05216388_10022 [Halorientalis persicus]|uniref:Halobacterial output domain-containing protein n=1 Tax=Halorientalis persicus TaxID=1367881 RepID=A0A1H8EHB3_9EURY|nr:HalOD1 output domain-containing protein [Halorientalis persicus]SEN18514.1 hypothetical protein SAMN05216388_10022 [Halorientalis persicus]